MIKNLTSYLDYGIFAEIALAIFAAVFIAIVIRTLMTRRDVSEQNARIVLGEHLKGKV
ncbi:MAG: hypothetical protein AB8B55_18170 [Mariniblastus sp.]